MGCWWAGENPKSEIRIFSLRYRRSVDPDSYRQTANEPQTLVVVVGIRGGRPRR